MKARGQQTFSLKTSSEKTFANFMVGANQAVIQQLQDIQLFDVIYLWGDSGAGCTHLLQACVQHFQQKNNYALYVDLSCCDWSLLLKASDYVQLLVIDHLEAAKTKEQQEILFHLYNRGVQKPYGMVWAAHTPPDGLPFGLLDLRSRLASSLVYRVESLDDEGKQRVLQAYAKNVGIKLSLPVIRFLLAHHPRSLKEQLTLLDQLDKISLQYQRPLTIPFLKKVLE